MFNWILLSLAEQAQGQGWVRKQPHTLRPGEKPSSEFLVAGNLVITTCFCYLNIIQFSTKNKI